MQDRTFANSTKSSCNARPDHTLGQLGLSKQTIYGLGRKVA
jgi:hypothetical protein